MKATTYQDSDDGFCIENDCFREPYRRIHKRIGETEAQKKLATSISAGG